MTRVRSEIKETKYQMEKISSKVNVIPVRKYFAKKKLSWNVCVNWRTVSCMRRCLGPDWQTDLIVFMLSALLTPISIRPPPSQSSVTLRRGRKRKWWESCTRWKMSWRFVWDSRHRRTLRLKIPRLAATVLVMITPAVLLAKLQNNSQLRLHFWSFTSNYYLSRCGGYFVSNNKVNLMYF